MQGSEAALTTTSTINPPVATCLEFYWLEFERRAVQVFADKNPPAEPEAIGFARSIARGFISL